MSGLKAFKGLISCFHHSLGKEFLKILTYVMNKDIVKKLAK